MISVVYNNTGTEKFLIVIAISFKIKKVDVQHEENKQTDARDVMN